LYWHTQSPSKSSSLQLLLAFLWIIHGSTLGKEASLPSENDKAFVLLERGCDAGVGMGGVSCLYEPHSYHEYKMMY
jgi:hypothetical protein